MVLRLYLVRHGETAASREGGYSGSGNPPLTEAGQQMAQALADTYAGLDWQAAYVSPMLRAQETAQPLCQQAKLSMRIRDGLREIDFGVWEDRTPDEVMASHQQDYLHWLAEPAWNPPTGGESAVVVASRVSLVIQEITETIADGNVLVVSHKATLRILLCNLLGIDLGRYRDRIAMPVASLSILSFDQHGPCLERLGDRSHLPPELRDRAGT
ncbi:histidine phosphatase family protein [Synechococcus elongatus]|uniref:Histidine phosphatase family protein n=1 Tax=Synechococcus elongatus PCC 11802 TaxID=2283154 RepID=A0AAT9JTP0_SYNEL